MGREKKPISRSLLAPGKKKKETTAAQAIGAFKRISLFFISHEYAK